MTEPRSLSQRTWQILRGIRERADQVRRGTDPAQQRKAAEEALAKIDPAEVLPKLSREALISIDARTRDDGGLC